jgi:hypothetical protein
MCSWMLLCRNIVLLTVRFVGVSKFTCLIPLSLLISCRLSFSVVGFKMSSLRALTLESHNRLTSC